MAASFDCFIEKRSLKRPLLIIFAILLADQLLKIWIKTNMYLGQEFEIAPWFIIHFTENNGMAFGLEFGGNYGKLFLSVFRILFVSGLGYYLWKLTKEKASSYYITVIALVFAGAVGNIIDSVFYGVIFDTPRIQNFWMKEMNFPIDIVWIDDDFHVIDIINNVLPTFFNS